MPDKLKMQVVLASRNAGKIGEMRELLQPHGVEVKSVTDFGDLPEVVENGDTFAANAAKKAREIAQEVGLWTIGEDSGLRVDALDGAPGVYSARFAGEPSDDERNNAKLISELDDVPAEKRGAEYVCHVAVADASGEIRLSEEATCRGRIATSARGSNGFGYDPYFLIPELHRTFGELPAVVKRHISHRARAFERVIPKLLSVLRDG